MLSPVMREGEKMKAEADDGGRNNEGGDTERENRDGAIEGSYSGIHLYKGGGK